MRPEEELRSFSDLNEDGYRDYRKEGTLRRSRVFDCLRSIGRSFFSVGSFATCLTYVIRSPYLDEVLALEDRLEANVEELKSKLRARHI